MLGTYTFTSHTLNLYPTNMLTNSTLMVVRGLDTRDTLAPDFA